MSARTVAIALGVLLLASNAWWALQLFDAGISYTYLKTSSETSSRQALAAIAAANEALGGAATRERVIEVVQRKAGGSEPFEKDGAVWVGEIGLRFDQSGRLVGLVGEPEK